MQHVWLSPLKDECQACGETFNGVMYDASVLYGPRKMWANVCHGCFVSRGGRLGIGYGQKYELTRQGDDLLWLGVDGF